VRLRELLGPSSEGEDALRRAGAILDEGLVLLAPTDTVPGLLASALRAEGLGRLADLKGRDRSAAPPVILPSAEAALLETDDEQRELLARVAVLWPGPLSVVVCAPRLGPIVNPSLGTVAVRVPALGWLRELALGRPIAASSANRHGQPTLRVPAAALASLGEEVELARRGLAGVLDAQGGDGLRASTIVDLVSHPPRLVRAGALAASAVEGVLGLRLARDR